MKSSGLSSPERASRPGCVHTETVCDQLQCREDYVVVGVEAISDGHSIKVVQNRKATYETLRFLRLKISVSLCTVKAFKNDIFLFYGYYSSFSPLIYTVLS